MSDLIINNQKFPFQTDTMHQELVEIQNRIFTPLGFKCSHPARELESAEYCAYSFKLNDFFVRFRVAKITPTKIGQFVTLWKRLKKGPIQPYGSTDSVDFFIINTRNEDRFGQFIFPKSVLCQHDVFSINGGGGKRAIRVYPPWDVTVNKQAKKTQKWQLEYFLEIPKNSEINLTRAKLLYR